MVYMADVNNMRNELNKLVSWSEEWQTLFNDDIAK